MEIWIVVIVIAIWAFISYKTELGYYQKMTVKAVLAYITGGAFVLSVLALLVTIGSAISIFYENTVETRLDNYSWYCSKGDFDSLAMMLKYDESYEEEFDYLWEQVDMYDTYNQYQIYKKAAEMATEEKDRAFYMEQALECKQILLDICNESIFKENELYAEYYGLVVWE